MAPKARSPVRSGHARVLSARLRRPAELRIVPMIRLRPPRHPVEPFMAVPIVRLLPVTIPSLRGGAGQRESAAVRVKDAGCPRHGVVVCPLARGRCGGIPQRTCDAASAAATSA